MALHIVKVQSRRWPFREEAGRPSCPGTLYLFLRLQEFATSAFSRDPRVRLRRLRRSLEFVSHLHAPQLAATSSLSLSSLRGFGSIKSLLRGNDFSYGVHLYGVARPAVDHPGCGAGSRRCFAVSPRSCPLSWEPQAGSWSSGTFCPSARNARPGIPDLLNIRRWTSASTTCSGVLRQPLRPIPRSTGAMADEDSSW